MEIHKFILDEIDEENLTIGLVNLVEEMPNFEFFYKINQSSSLNFSRIKDIIYEGHYYNYHFPVYEAYDKTSKICYRIIANKSSESIQKKEITELFTEETKNAYLLKNKKKIDYLIKTSDVIPDFSLILLPENLALPVQEYQLSSEEEPYQLIQYYE